MTSLQVLLKARVRFTPASNAVAAGAWRISTLFQI
jgi:hypothetical protein